MRGWGSVDAWGRLTARISWNYVDPPPGGGYVVSAALGGGVRADREAHPRCGRAGRDSNRPHRVYRRSRLGAEDVIDIHITVSDLDAADGLTRALRTAWFRHGITPEDDLFHRKSETDPGVGQP